MAARERPHSPASTPKKMGRVVRAYHLEMPHKQTETSEMRGRPPRFKGTGWAGAPWPGESKSVEKKENGPLPGQPRTAPSGASAVHKMDDQGRRKVAPTPGNRKEKSTRFCVSALRTHTHKHPHRSGRGSRQPALRSTPCQHPQSNLVLASPCCICWFCSYAHRLPKAL
jgi:hypothetical protein